MSPTQGHFVEDWATVKKRWEGWWQCLSVRPEETEPLLCEVRPEGLFMVTSCRSEGQGRALLERVAARY
jgi:hypothetical protein